MAQMYIPMKQKQTHRHREQTCGGRGGGGGGGMDWEFGVRKCKLLYTGWINNEVLVYSTGNYIQYPVINHNGKENKKEQVCVCVCVCVCIYIKRNNFTVQKKLTQNWKSTILQ